MKKFYKYIGIVAGILLVLVVVLFVLAKFLITPERVREAVLPLARNALHREVQLSGVQVSLFSGISLSDLVIRENAGPETFVSADRVILRYQFWPLLFKRVIIEEVLLDGPTIRVTRFADGRFNFSDLLGSAAEDIKKPQEPVRTKAEEKADSGIDLLVSEISVVNGKVRFVDYALGATEPYRYTLTGLNVNARDISFKNTFPFKAKTQLNGSTLDVEGELDLQTLHGKGKILLADLDVTAFKPYFSQLLPGKLSKLKASLDLSAEGDPKTVTSRGNISLKQIDLVLDASEDTPIQNATLSIDYAVRADLVASLLEIANSEVAFNSIPVTIAGGVRNYTSQPEADLTLVLSEMKLRPALAALPKKLVKSLQELDPAGLVNARIHLRGSLADPIKLLREGEVRLEGVQATAAGLRPALTGVLTIKGDSVVSKNLKMKIGGNQTTIDFSANNLSGKPIVVSSELSADRFVLGPMLKTAVSAEATDSRPPREPRSEQKNTLPAKKTSSSEPGPYNLPLKATGVVRVGQVLYKDLVIDNLLVRYRLENNVLQVDTLTGNLAGGTFNKTARVDLGKKGLAYSTQLSLKGLQAEPLITAFLPKATGTVFGDLTLNANMSSNGTLSETIRKNLSGKGNFLLKNWKLTGAGLAGDASDLMNLQDLRVLRFSRAGGNFTIQNGKVSLSSNFSGSDVRMSPRGTIGLDGTLDVALNSLLSPGLTKKLGGKAGLTTYLTDNQGWTRLPLKLVGTTKSPRLVLDPNAVHRLVEKELKKEIQKKLQEDVFEKMISSKKEQKGNRRPAGEEEQKKETKNPGEKLFEDTLRGLFGQ
jgi:AsmA protein